MRDTSIMAYRDLQTTNKLSVNRKKVLEALMDASQPLTDKELAQRLGWPINCVTGRRGELVAVGLVESAGKEKRDGKTVTVWRVVTAKPSQLEIVF